MPEFLAYSHKRFGLKFTILALFMYFSEELVAAFGIFAGIVRFFLFNRRNLDFKIGAKP